MKTGKQPSSEMAVLIVEDDYLQAHDLAAALNNAGMVVIGPASTLQDAAGLLDRHLPSAAILDLNLHGQASLSIAEKLQAEHVPFAFVTGYHREVLPERFSAVPLFEKPVPEAAVIAALDEWNLFSPDGWMQIRERIFVRAVLRLYEILQGPYLYKGSAGPHVFKGFCPSSEPRLFDCCRAILPEFQDRVWPVGPDPDRPASLYPMSSTYMRQLRAWTALGRLSYLSALETRLIVEATLPPAHALPIHRTAARRRRRISF
ncbi:MAG: response regulator [Mesorhizobium sp.]|nr:response regulator [Mesorhizobium sp.]